MGTKKCEWVPMMSLDELFELIERQVRHVMSLFSTLERVRRGPFYSGEPSVIICAKNTVVKSFMMASK